MKKILFILALILSCSENKIINDNQLIIGLASDPTTLDPIFALDSSSIKINQLLFRKLFIFEKDGKIEKDLVKKFKVNNNILEIELVEQELKSEDVKFSLDRLRKEISPKRKLYENIEEIKIINETNLLIKYNLFKQKDIENLAFASASIYNKKEFLENKKFISSGLYKLTEWKKNDSLSFEKNVSNKTIPNKLIIQVLSQPSSAIYLYKKNILDLMKIPYFLLTDSFLKQEKIIQTKGKSLQYIAINHTNQCFDKNFRRALNHSIDRNLIIEKVFSNFAEEVHTSIPSTYMKKITNRNYTFIYNLIKAKEYLSKSKCYPQILERKIDFRMRADDENKAKSEALAEDLKKLGLKISINMMEKAKLYKENSEMQGDLTLLTWYIDFDSITNFIDPIFASDQFGSAGNRSFYKDELIQKEILVLRTKNYSNKNILTITERLFESAPIVFLWSIDETYITSKKASQFPKIISIFTE